jgi:glycosyltransferase involved in cell wall biosynthesis
MVDEFELQDFVHFRPHEEETEYAYAAFDIFVLASQSETYGMVTVEALASGLPVIGTADGGTLSLITPEVNGLLFTPDDSADLTEKLLQVIEDPAFAANLAMKAEIDAIEKYSHIAQCERWEKIFSELGKGESRLRHPMRPAK